MPQSDCFLPPIADSIKDKNGCTFVHCHAGISRSATICIAYIMKTMQLDLSKAYELVKEKRPCISPNLHFMGQLLEFQKQLQVGREQEQRPQSGEDDMADGDVDMTLCCPAASGMYYDVSLHEEDNDYESSRCSSTIPSASAPSSLNFDNSRQDEPMELSTQVLTQTIKHRVINKPKTLPLRKSVSVQERPVERPLLCADGLFKDRQLLNSVSLPTTPIISQYKNHLRYCRTPSPLPYSKPRPLQHSPCRVEATLGSRSETNLNHYHPLAESK